MTAEKQPTNNQNPTIKQRVQSLLEQNIDARKDNNKLFMLYIFQYFSKEEVTEMTAYDFINKIYWEDSIPSVETLVRTARRVKKQNPALRTDDLHGEKKEHKLIFKIKNTEK